MMYKDRLAIPGPTTLPPAVIAAATHPMVDERTVDFARVFTRIIDGLRQVLGTAGDVLIFSSSTTGAFESAVQNLFSPGEKVLVVNNGAFGMRWVALCRAYGLETVVLDVEWGCEPDPAVVEACLEADSHIVAAIVVHCETSTGVVTDLEAIGRATRSVLTIVDSASGVGGCEMQADAWGLDVVVGGTQKALMAPPGVSFVSVSERAWRRHAEARHPRYYFDWTITRDSLNHSIPRTPWTPAVGVLLQLSAALEQVLAEGMERRHRRHSELGRMARAGLRGLGLRLLTPEAARNGIVTAAFTPPGIGAGPLVDAVVEHTGVQLATGNGELADQVVRVGHCGHTDPLDLVTALAALETGLAALGAPVPPGSGVTPIVKLMAEQVDAAASPLTSTSPNPEESAA
ncbi:alanine--glyoxylate aminotransferase family protein [Streptomyces anulatus]|uniref:pyridoxal-phosphate-dependent aminotransferase family protein n=1 Tax=Streptomyces anulatus TaxID=1892 RepID=UPI00325001D4|nr:alanine--glyoxylate aminotransferase family protein [Streptomyces anulatus]WSU87987.1 alanine--glyoxylate aminotransferase family protein [Streptomyces anulatus]